MGRDYELFNVTRNESHFIGKPGEAYILDTVRQINSLGWDLNEDRIFNEYLETESGEGSLTSDEYRKILYLQEEETPETCSQEVSDEIEKNVKEFDEKHKVGTKQDSVEAQKHDKEFRKNLVKLAAKLTTKLGIAKYTDYRFSFDLGEIYWIGVTLLPTSFLRKSETNPAPEFIDKLTYNIKTKGVKVLTKSAA